MRFVLNNIQTCNQMRFSSRKRFSIVKNPFLEGCNRLKSLSKLYFFRHTSTCIYCVFAGVDLMKYTNHGQRRLPRKIFGVLSMQIGLKCTKKPGLKSFHKACPKKIGHSIRVPIPIQPYENASGQDTGSLPVTKVTIRQIIRIITLNWKIFHAKFLKSVWK